MRRRTLLLVALAATLLVAAVLVRAVRPLAAPALGFVAKTVCSDVFVGGFTPAQALSSLPDEPIAGIVRTRIDMGARRVRASVPLIARREAHFRDGLGCTLDSLALSARLSAPAAGAAATGSRRRPARSRERDGWIIPEGAAAAIDTAAMDRAMDEAFSEPGRESLRRTRAIVIVHAGHIVAERYAPGFGPDSRFPGWSMTKSVINALVGVLTGDGRLDPGTNALRPEWRAADDPRAAITLHHLLQMSSGLHFDESYSPTGGATRMLFASADAAAVAAESPLRHPPGSRFAYSSATTNLISAIIREALGSDSAYLAFPRAALFERVDMRSAIMEPDPSGTFVGSSFMYATARDWARFGQLYLQDGVWEGQRILPDGWVEYSTTPASAARLGEYGAHWWLNAGAPGDSTRRLWPGLPTDVYSATGFQGQYVMVVPAHDLVVVRLGLTADDRMWDMASFVARVIRALGGGASTAASDT
jgi:CubicO group peptidase (beta-lactamase class C family)